MDGGGAVGGVGGASEEVEAPAVLMGEVGEGEDEGGAGDAFGEGDFSAIGWRVCGRPRGGGMPSARRMSAVPVLLWFRLVRGRRGAEVGVAVVVAEDVEIGGEDPGGLMGVEAGGD